MRTVYLHIYYLHILRAVVLISSVALLCNGIRMLDGSASMGIYPLCKLKKCNYFNIIMLLSNECLMLVGLAAC